MVIKPNVLKTTADRNFRTTERLVPSTGFSGAAPTFRIYKLKSLERETNGRWYTSIYMNVSLLQRGRQLRGDDNDESHIALHGQSGVETAGHLQIVLRDQRRVLSVRRANVLHEVRVLDLRRIHGEQNVPAPAMVTRRVCVYEINVFILIRPKR